MGAPSRTSSAYIWLDSRIASLMVAMSDTWLPTWKCNRRSSAKNPASRSVSSKKSVSRAPKPNLASSPDVAPHCPSCVVPSRTRTPSKGLERGFVFVFKFVRLVSRKRSRMGSSSESFSTTSATLVPAAAASNATRTYDASLYPLHTNKGAYGVCTSFFVCSKQHERMTATASRSSALLPASSPNARGAPEETSARSSSTSWQHFTGNTPWYAGLGPEPSAEASAEDASASVPLSTERRLPAP
mmetsp:Transcript_6837/g.27945  ORF Transcript_6837/g.27945 Transcript_6837/m.27945 type:complete len:243 (-) Transcript_6837:522-1250(-)